jgi:predicted lipoprotein with Yx(FWY)xxD motif
MGIRLIPVNGEHAMRNGWLVPAGAIATVLVVAACGSSNSNTSSGGSGSGSSPSAAATSPAASSGTTLKAGKVGHAKVLTNARGFTLYWFGPDTSTTSNCNGSCAKYWPPVPGPATAGAGVTGKIGVITRSNGSKQATYNGHPLYTYVGDTAPGMAKGNGTNLSGGIWHDIVLSGSAAPAPSPSQSSSSGGYGY